MSLQCYNYSLSLATGKIGVSAPLVKLRSTLLFNTIVANSVLSATKLLYQSSMPILIPKHTSQRPAQTPIPTPALHLHARDSAKWLGIKWSSDSFHLLIIPLISCVQERSRKERQLSVLEMLMLELCSWKKKKKKKRSLRIVFSILPILLVLFFTSYYCPPPLYCISYLIV
jgi:hypothetical protein